MATNQRECEQQWGGGGAEPVLISTAAVFIVSTVAVQGLKAV